MLIALLIIARTAQIGASILFAGTFTFELVTLGPAGWLCYGFGWKSRT